MPRHCKGSGSKTKATLPSKNFFTEAAPSICEPSLKSWVEVVKGCKVSVSEEAAMSEVVPIGSLPALVAVAHAVLEETDPVQVRAEAEIENVVSTLEEAGPIFDETEPLRPGGLTSCLCRGRLVQVLSTYGWIEPLDKIEHPDLHKHGGRIFFSRSDLWPGTPLFIGAELTFRLYADIDGLGAEDCHHSSLSVKVKTALSGAAKSFTPGLTWPYCDAAGAVAYHAQCQPNVLTDSHVLNTSKGHDCKEKDDGDLPPTSRGTGGLSRVCEFHQKQPYSFLPPPGLAPPPGLEDCSALKVEG